MISSQSLSCGYPDRTVLSGIDAEVKPGEIVALLGQNGSGKSTLLKTFIGEIPALAGSIELCGKPFAQFSPRERAQKISFVPSEERSQFPFLAREIVAMGRTPHADGMFDSEEDKRITNEALATAECNDIASRPITQLSAGERQRVLIARALAQKAPVMLLDEPTSHFDPGHQVSFVVLCRKLASSGLAMLIALHDLNLAAHLATRAYLISEGKITSQGAIGEVLESPALDAAYKTSFDRIKGLDGIVRLSPKFV